MQNKMRNFIILITLIFTATCYADDYEMGDPDLAGEYFRMYSEKYQEN